MPDVSQPLAFVEKALAELTTTKESLKKDPNKTVDGQPNSSTNLAYATSSVRTVLSDLTKVEKLLVKAAAEVAPTEAPKAEEAAPAEAPKAEEATPA